MESSKKERWGEIIGAAVINGISCALLTFVLGFTAVQGLCPPCFVPLVFAAPVVLMKWPMEAQAWIFGEYPRESENTLKIASIAGGFVGIFGLIFTIIFSLILFVFFQCLTATTYRCF